jgi:hypothetical protein
MANCVICNAEFNPSWGGSKKLCPKHCVPARRATDDQVGEALKKIFGAIFLAGLSILVIIFVYACVASDLERNSEAYPKDVLDHHMSVVDGRKELNITLELRKGSGDDFFLSLAPDDMKEILKHEQQQNSGEDDLVFHVVGDIGGGYNDYGNPRPSNVVLLFDTKYTKFDIMQINWEHHPGPGSLLNIGVVSNISEYGASVGRSYCQEAREWTQVFCENF